MITKEQIEAGTKESEVLAEKFHGLCEEVLESGGDLVDKVSTVLTALIVTLGGVCACMPDKEPEDMGDFMRERLVAEIKMFRQQISDRKINLQ